MASVEKTEPYPYEAATETMLAPLKFLLVLPGLSNMQQPVFYTQNRSLANSSTREKLPYHIINAPETNKGRHRLVMYDSSNIAYYYYTTPSFCHKTVDKRSSIRKRPLEILLNQIRKKTWIESMQEELQQFDRLDVWEISRQTKSAKMS
ncbi:hypothetical protein Tco_0717364 [Tanacetum coccineum]